MLRQTQRLWSSGHRAALSGATAAALGLTWSLQGAPAQAAAPPPALDPAAFKPFTLTAVEVRDRVARECCALCVRAPVARAATTHVHTTAARPPLPFTAPLTPSLTHLTQRVSHDTAVYRFALNNDSVAGLPVASCLLVRAPLGPEGKPVVRPYTPISHPHERHLDLLVKSYPAGVMSKHFAALKVGDQVRCVRRAELPASCPHPLPYCCSLR